MPECAATRLNSIQANLSQYVGTRHSKGLMSMDMAMKVAQCAVEEVMNDRHERQQASQGPSHGTPEPTPVAGLKRKRTIVEISSDWGDGKRR